MGIIQRRIACLFLGLSAFPALATIHSLPHEILKAREDFSIKASLLQPRIGSLSTDDSAAEFGETMSRMTDDLIEMMGRDPGAVKAQDKEALRKIWLSYLINKYALISKPDSNKSLALGKLHEKFLGLLQNKEKFPFKNYNKFDPRYEPSSDPEAVWNFADDIYMSQIIAPQGLGGPIGGGGGSSNSFSTAGGGGVFSGSPASLGPSVLDEVGAEPGSAAKKYLSQMEPPVEPNYVPESKLAQNTGASGPSGAQGMSGGSSLYNGAGSNFSAAPPYSGGGGGYQSPDTSAGGLGGSGSGSGSSGSGLDSLESAMKNIKPNGGSGGGSSGGNSSLSNGGGAGISSNYYNYGSGNSHSGDSSGPEKKDAAASGGKAVPQTKATAADSAKENMLYQVSATHEGLSPKGEEKYAPEFDKAIQYARDLKLGKNPTGPAPDTEIQEWANYYISHNPTALHVSKEYIRGAKKQEVFNKAAAKIQEKACAEELKKMQPKEFNELLNKLLDGAHNKHVYSILQNDIEKQSELTLKRIGDYTDQSGDVRYKANRINYVSAATDDNAQVNLANMKLIKEGHTFLNAMISTQSPSCMLNNMGDGGYLRSGCAKFEASSMKDIKDLKTGDGLRIAALFSFVDKIKLNNKTGPDPQSFSGAQNFIHNMFIHSSPEASSSMFKELFDNKCGGSHHWRGMIKDLEEKLRAAADKYCKVTEAQKMQAEKLKWQECLVSSSGATCNFNNPVEKNNHFINRGRYENTFSCKYNHYDGKLPDEIDGIGVYNRLLTLRGGYNCDKIRKHYLFYAAALNFDLDPYFRNDTKGLREGDKNAAPHVDKTAPKLSTKKP